MDEAQQHAMGNPIITWSQILWFTRVDYCMYGAAWKKPIGIPSNYDTSSLATLCCHKRHAIVLQGTAIDPSTNRIASATAVLGNKYPTRMVTRWTKLLSRVASGWAVFVQLLHLSWWKHRHTRHQHRHHHRRNRHHHLN